MGAHDEVSVEVSTEEQELLLGEGKMYKEIFDFVKDIVIIVGLVLIIRLFIAIPFQINGHSMDTSYYDKEFIIVDRFSYLDIPHVKSGYPKRGDVIVFKPNVSEEKKYYIKRIIGLPGDEIKISEGKVYIRQSGEKNPQLLDEPYLSTQNNGSTFVKGEPSTYIFNVPEGEYFVMGDNRIASTDSRSCFSSCMIEGSTNYVPRTSIIGRMFIDLGYFDWIRSIFPLKFGEFRFIHPELGIDTHPRFFSTQNSFDYNLK